MKIVGMMRIKNEQRWIARVLESMLPVCEQIFILDDHSEDETRDICRSYSQVTLFESPFEGLNETRDKNWLIEKVERLAPESTWIVCIDGDEEIAPGSAEQIRWIADRQGATRGTFRFQVLYLWDSEAQYRVDGIYAGFHRPSMFRLVPGQRFHSAFGGGFHCGNVPESAGATRTNVKLLHYGYLHREDRIRKWEFYNTHDPRNRTEGYEDTFPERRTYPHIVQGDVPEVPANVKLMHAGPLKLQPLESVIPHVAAV
jgi:glycosyltransferase involved in cell wall biosynthesis